MIPDIKSIIHQPDAEYASVMRGNIIGFFVVVIIILIYSDVDKSVLFVMGVIAFIVTRYIVKSFSMAKWKAHQRKIFILQKTHNIPSYEAVDLLNKN